MRRKKENWLVAIYNDNKLYVWIIIGILMLSGVSIGMAMGQSKSNGAKVLENNKDYSYDEVNIKQTNVEPINNDVSNKKEKKIVKDEENSTAKKDNIIEFDDNESIVEIISNKKLEFIMPLEGEISKDFSQDTLMYSNTLQQWVSHMGVDILSEKAMPVKAIEDGTVIDIKQDPRYGYTIIIDHGQGYNSIYCNLSTLDMVYLNKSVEKGQVISGVGDTALFESKDNSHLHFELIKDDEYVNPITYIKGE